MSQPAEFERNLLKYLSEEAHVQRDVPARATCGPFNLDVLIEVGARKVVFLFGSTEWGAAMLLGDGVADVVYNLSLPRVMRDLEDTLYLISRRDPDLFTKRGRSVLRRLATEDARAAARTDSVLVSVAYRSRLHGSPPEPEVLSFFRTQRQAEGDRRPFWRAAYEFGKTSTLLEGPCGLEEMHKRWEDWVKTKVPEY